MEKEWLSTHPLKQLTGVPDYGYRLRMDHKFKEPCRPFTLPRLHQIPGLLGMSYRYARAWFEYYKAGKKMFIDNFDLCPWKPIYGAPIGGIGCGTIGRGNNGEFCRFQMVPGMYKHHVVEADQFTVCVRRGGETTYQQVLSPHQPRGQSLRAWKWGFPADKATYHALYPRSWTVYDLPGQDIRLICRQVSPIFPHNYQETSYPCAAFVWSIENNSDSSAEVSIMFSFKNGQGDATDRDGGVYTCPFTHRETEVENEAVGVEIHQEFRGSPCIYGISALKKPGVSVTYRTAFNPSQPCREIWDDLNYDGQLDSFEVGEMVKTKCGEEIACAVCARVEVEGQGVRHLEFSLVWHMPIIQFGSKEVTHTRRYARYIGIDELGARKLSAYALNHYAEWESCIEEWQYPILTNSCLPSWYKSALFNELYFLSDGGTVWVNVPPHSPISDMKHNHTPNILTDYGRFAYLEGHEYRMYNTYDVHHYASFALLMLWPKLQLSLQYDIAHSVPREQPEEVKFCMSGEYDVSKARNCVPHDVGDPDDEPWKRMNAYIIHPTKEWKDLNTKFILSVYRDYVHTGDRAFLQDVYPMVKSVLEASLRWDVDDDGIIDNAGFADQTYDAWSVSGASAYCGGMWLGALKMFIVMAQLLQQPEDEAKYQLLLKKACRSFEEKLWNGEYYNYDSSNSSHHNSIMADQLAGHWFLKASLIEDNSVFPKDHVLKALRTIFTHNVLPFDGGRMGAINGMRPNGKKDLTSVQSDEFWTGVTYGLAATMIQEGMLEEGWQTAYGAYHTCYERYGLGFQTPEAYFEDRRYRSLGYMRPLAIWSIQYALEKFHPKLM